MQTSNEQRARTSFFDHKAFHGALDAERRNRGLSWRQVADEAGVNASTLTRLGQGRRPDVDGLAALVSWAGVPADLFIRSSRRAAERPGTLTVVSSQLHSDPYLSNNQATAIFEMFRANYESLQSGSAEAPASEPASDDPQ